MSKHIQSLDTESEESEHQMAVIEEVMDNYLPFLDYKLSTIK